MLSVRDVDYGRWFDATSQARRLPRVVPERDALAGAQDRRCERTAQNLQRDTVPSSLGRGRLLGVDVKYCDVVELETRGCVRFRDRDPRLVRGPWASLVELGEIDAGGLQGESQLAQVFRSAERNYEGALLDRVEVLQLAHQVVDQATGIAPQGGT